MSKGLKVKCPQCKKVFLYSSSKNRPFCSERCKMIDMGHWFEGNYVIEGRDNTVYIEDPELFLNKEDGDEQDGEYN